jgi:hypothetical protein
VRVCARHVDDGRAHRTRATLTGCDRHRYFVQRSQVRRRGALLKIFAAPSSIESFDKAADRIFPCEWCRDRSMVV